MKIVWYWHQDRLIGRWSRIYSPEIDPHIYSQLIFSKCANTIIWGKSLYFQQTLLKHLTVNMQQTNKTFWISCTIYENLHNWFKDPNCKLKAITLLEEIQEKNFVTMVRQILLRFDVKNMMHIRKKWIN